MMRIYQFELRVLLTTSQGMVVAEPLELKCLGGGSDALEAITSLATEIKAGLEHGEPPYREPSAELVDRWISCRGGNGEAVTLKIWGVYDAPQVAATNSP